MRWIKKKKKGTSRKERFRCNLTPKDLEKTLVAQYEKIFREKKKSQNEI